ncbi:MAG: hypothetical protein M3P33_00170 [bacterium]|nr:hypothetical protein [bacterium]
MIYLLFTLAVFAIAIIYLIKYHAALKNDIHYNDTLNNSNTYVLKVFVDNKIIELTNNGLVVDGHLAHIQKTGHFDELIELLSRSIDYPKVYSNINFYGAIKSLLENKYVTPYLLTQPLLNIQILSYRKDLGYGGVYAHNIQSVGIADLIGEPSAILCCCSNIHDKQEIIRVASKWASQDLATLAVATTEDSDSSKNILIRGVRGKMMFLGLIAIQKNNNSA